MEISNMVITSDAFKDGENIPTVYTCDGQDVSPELKWEGIPIGTKSIALIMDDPDAPGGTFVHWVVFNIPSDVKELPEAVISSKALKGSTQGMTSFGKSGYGGPCPPPGKPHRYYFKVYALDIRLGISPGVTKADVEHEMKNHILAKGELMGRYER